MSAVMEGEARLIAPDRLAGHLGAARALAILSLVAAGAMASSDWSTADAVAVALAAGVILGSAAPRVVQRVARPPHWPKWPGWTRRPAFASPNRPLVQGAAAPQRTAATRTRPRQPGSAHARRVDHAAAVPPTKRELDVVRLVAQGLTTDQVAEALQIEPRTVRTHLKHLAGKAGTHGRMALVERARQAGWLKRAR
jgi:DNA-binding CsgD family transcriptional regulator